MKNRIRRIRQRRNLTLRELSAAVGTTPQSVSRLETGNMTLSTEWLERFAAALNVHPVDLLEGPDDREISLLGTLKVDGQLVRSEGDSVTFDAMADLPVAIRLGCALGRYDVGDILVGNKLQNDEHGRAVDAECIAETTSGAVILCRCHKNPAEAADGLLLVPLDAAVAPLDGAAIKWLAPIAMRISYPNA